MCPHFSSEGDGVPHGAVSIHEVTRDGSTESCSREGVCCVSVPLSPHSFLASPATSWLGQLGSSLSISLDKNV